ncbi:MAG: hypothetical protein OEM07_02570 [Gammaproteobacteria bacterium]|nr:hypothetical protein [Gammaproteobacteria bacterium]
MKKANAISKLFSAALFFIFTCSINANAEEGKIVLSNKVFKQVIKKDKDGNVTYDYIDAELAVPGDVMMYRIVFENIGNESASGIVINDPIPNNTKYRINSASGRNTTITFSIDGGKSFGNPDDLVVKDKDGKEWKAKPESYTHIRWVYNKLLAPTEKGEVSFKAQIKGNE